MNTMSLNQIRAFNPCRLGYAKLLAAQGRTMPDDVQIPLLDILESNGIRDAIWCMRVNWFEYKNIYMQFVGGCIIRANRNAIYATAAAYAADATAATAYAADAAAYATAAADAIYAAADAAAIYATAYAADAAERQIQKQHLTYLLRNSY